MIVTQSAPSRYGTRDLVTSGKLAKRLEATERPCSEPDDRVPGRVTPQWSGAKRWSDAAAFGTRGGAVSHGSVAGLECPADYGVPDPVACDFFSGRSPLSPPQTMGKVVHWSRINFRPEPLRYISGTRGTARIVQPVHQLQGCDPLLIEPALLQAFGFRSPGPVSTFNSRHSAYRRGIIERWGRGTLKMMELADNAGLPQPEIEDDGGCVTVRFRHEAVPVHLIGRSETEVGGSAALSVEHQGMEDLDDQQKAILDLLKQVSSPLALREIRARLDPQPDERRVREDLAILKAKGLAILSGRGRGAR